MSVGDAHYIKRDILSAYIRKYSAPQCQLVELEKKAGPLFFSKKLRRAKPFMVATTRPTHFHRIHLHFLKKR